MLFLLLLCNDFPAFLKHFSNILCFPASIGNWLLEPFNNAINSKDLSNLLAYLAYIPCKVVSYSADCISIALHSICNCYDYLIPKNVPVDHTNVADFADQNLHTDMAQTEVKKDSLLSWLKITISESIFGPDKKGPDTDPIIPSEVVSEPATPTESTFVEKGKAVDRNTLFTREEFPQAFNKEELLRPAFVADTELPETSRPRLDPTELMNTRYAELDSNASDNDLTPTNSVILPTPPSPSPVTDALRNAHPSWETTPPNSPNSLRRAASFATGGLTPPTTTF